MVKASKVGISLPGIIGVGQPPPKVPGFAFLEWEVPLGALQNTSIRHDSRVAEAAGKIAELYLTLFSNDISDKRYDSIFGNRNTSRLIPVWISHVVHAGDPVRCEIDRRIEDDSSGRDPVFLRAETGLVSRFVPQDLGSLLLEPLKVTGGLVPRGVDRVALVDGANGNPIVVVG